MNTRLTLLTWHRETADELETARAELAALQKEHSDAVENAKAAERDVRDLHAVLAGIDKPSRLITGRAHELEAAQSTARGNRTRTAGLLANARSRVAELELAHGQLDELLNPIAATEAA